MIGLEKYPSSRCRLIPFFLSKSLYNLTCSFFWTMATGFFLTSCEVPMRFYCGTVSLYVNFELLAPGHSFTFSFKTELHSEICSTLKYIQYSLYAFVHMNNTHWVPSLCLAAEDKYFLCFDFLLMISDSLKYLLCVFDYLLFQYFSELITLRILVSAKSFLSNRCPCYFCFIFYFYPKPLQTIPNEEMP